MRREGVLEHASIYKLFFPKHSTLRGDCLIPANDQNIYGAKQVKIAMIKKEKLKNEGKFPYVQMHTMWSKQ